MDRTEILRRRLELYMAAEEKILNAQEYTIDSRRLRRADLPYVQKKITELSDEIRLLEAGNGNRKAVVF